MFDLMEFLDWQSTGKAPAFNVRVEDISVATPALQVSVCCSVWREFVEG